MNQLRKHYAFVYVLITAFLVMQWSPLHVHAGGHHDHGAGLHQHQQEVHSHDLSDHHDSIDSPEHGGDVSVVFFDHDPGLTLAKRLLPVSVIPSASSSLVFSPVVIRQARDTDAGSGYLYRTTLGPRAPPFFS